MGADNRANRADLIAGKKPVLRSLQPFLAGGMEHGQRIAALYAVAGFFT